MVFRCFVEKKPGFDGAARALCRELTEQLGVRGLERVRVLNRYDVEGVDAAVYAAARTAVFSEPQVDAIWDETMPPVEGPHALTAVEALPVVPVLGMDGVLGTVAGSDGCSGADRSIFTPDSPLLLRAVSIILIFSFGMLAGT